MKKPEGSSFNTIATRKKKLEMLFTIINFRGDLYVADVADVLRKKVATIIQTI